MRKFASTYVLLGIILSGSVSADVAADEMRAFDRPFLELVGAIEAPRGYDTVTGYAPFRPDQRITSMTIAEVMDWQRKIQAAGAKSTAVGRFQFILDTLEFLTRVHDVPHDTLLDRRTQDYLARVLMHRCGFYDPDRPVEELGDCLAGTWAALPILSEPKRGRSRYAGTANNHARITPKVVEAVLAIRFPPATVTLSTRSAPDTGDEVTAFMAGLSRKRLGTGTVVTDASSSEVLVDNRPLP